MRQGQQNRRGRGRNNNNNSNNNNHNRKSQNPLTRSFESAGPDVKLRGTPSHIAEKYITLARDALSSGDRVLAENYLQHAEHYNRIIMTYREQQISQGGVDPFNNGGARTHSLNSPDGSEGEEFSDEDGGGDDSNQGNGNGQVQPPQMMRGDGGAPQGDGQPRNFDQPQQRYDNRPHRSDNRNDNRSDNRSDNRYNNPRHDRGDNNRFDRNDRRGNDFRGDRQDRPERHDRFGGNGNDNRGFRDDRRPHNPSQNSSFEGQPSDGNGFRRRDRFPNQGNSNGGDRDRGPSNAEQFEWPVAASVPIAAPPPPVSPPVVAAVEQEQPAFLRRPVRRPRRDDAEAKPVAAPREPASEE